MRKLIQSWFVEILIVFVVIIAIIFYGEYYHVLIGVPNHIPSFAESLIIYWMSFIDFFNEIVRGAYLKPMVIGFSGLVLAWLVFRRIRWRLRRSDTFTSINCPKCNYPLVRIKRTLWQRRLSAFLPIRRLFCKKCKWKGLRIKSYDMIDVPSLGNRAQQKTATIKSSGE